MNFACLGLGQFYGNSQSSAGLSLVSKRIADVLADDGGLIVVLVNDDFKGVGSLSCGRVGELTDFNIESINRVKPRREGIPDVDNSVE